MKKVTIALPEEMIKEVKKLAKKMGDEDFWTLAITWRQLIKKGLAYFEKNEGKKKKGSSEAKTNEEPKDQRQYTTVPEENQNPEEIKEDINNMMEQIYPEDKNDKKEG